MPDNHVIVCGPACCPGCQDCYGYGIGCHQDPCRCDRPCVCTYDDDGDRIPNSCERHDSRADTRHLADRADPDVWPEHESLDAAPCPECGSVGACGYDDEGRAMVHTTEDDG